MSTNSALKARLTRLGPVQGADLPPSFYGEPVTLVLRLFSAMLGIDIDTLRNWEQGRNKRDQAAFEAIA